MHSSYLIMKCLDYFKVIMKSPRFPGLNSSSMVEFSSSFRFASPRRTEVPVFGGESLTAGPGWRIGTSPLWLQIIGTEQSLCLPFLIPTQELRNEGGNWSVVEREGQGVKKSSGYAKHRSLCASDSDEAMAYAKIRGHNQ